MYLIGFSFLHNNLVMNNLVYITTCIINNKNYIGSHLTNNINDSYLGSGLLVKRSIKKYGKENFKRKILKQFETKQEAFDAQEKYIKIYDTLSPNGYNISPKGGHGVKNSWSEESKRKISKTQKGRKVSEETKQKMKGHVFSDEHKEKLRQSKLGKKRKLFTEEHRKNLSKARKGRKLSEEHKEKLRNISSSKRPEVRQKMSESAKHRLQNKENHPLFGKKHSEESKQKMSNSHIGRTYEELFGKEKAIQMKKKRSKESKGRKSKSLYLGWIEKYGIEEGDLRYFKWKENLKLAKLR